MEKVTETVMPRWLPRALVMAISVVAGFLLGWWLLGRLQGLLILLFLAQFLAFALEPAVNWLAAHGWRRGWATGFVMLVGFLALGGFVVAVGSILVSQASTLADRFPSYLDQMLSWTNRTFDTNLSPDRLRHEITDRNGALSNYSARIARNAVGLSTGALGLLFQSFAVLLFTFYLCADGPRIRRAVCSVLPPARQREVLRAWEIAVQKTGGYLYSRLLLALASAFAHYLVLRILGVPYALALALWMGLVSQLVPTVGTYLAAFLPVVIALLTDPVDALVLLVFIIVYQQVENYLLQPRITAHTLNLHPAVAFASVIAGAATLGGVGALLAIPCTAIVQTFVGSYIRRYQVEEHPLTQPEPDRERGEPDDGEP